MFILATVVITIGFLFLIFQISKLNELNNLKTGYNYLISVNYINNLLVDSYNNHIIDWYYLDCKYRRKVLVLNPTIEGFRIMRISNILTNTEKNTLFIDSNKIKVVDQYNRKIFFRIIPTSIGNDLLMEDFLDSYSSKYYYIYFNCNYPDPQDDTLQDLNLANTHEYYYRLFNLEYRDSFEVLFTQLATSTLQQQAFSVLYFENRYNSSIETFNNQSDWIYYQAVKIG
ncbi:MAG: hypothetical protein ABGW69_01990 [Nanoarchaeota archaeon]